MRSRLHILIELGLMAGAVCLGILALTALVSADTTVPEADVMAAVRDYVSGTMQGGADVEIACRWRGDLTVEGAGPVTLHVGPSGVQGSAGGIPVSVEVRRGGKILRNLVITAETAYFDTVAVSARPLRRGDPLTPDAVRFERREVTQMLGRTFSQAEELDGNQMRVTLPAGRVVDRNLTEGVPLVRRGEVVTVLAEVGTITVSTRGRALSDGAAGDHVSVQNADRRRIQGQVVSPGVVKVIF